MTASQDEGTLYQIVFSGQLEPGVDKADAEQGIAKLFKANASQLALFFSGKRVVVKSGVPAAVAAKYELAFKKVGAVCSVEPLPSGAQSSHTQPSQAPSKLAANSSDSKSEAASSTEEVKPIQAALRLAPTGARLGPQRRIEKGPDVTADQYEVFPAGTELSSGQSEPVPDAPDVGHISIAPVGSWLGDEDGKKTPPPPDTSHLSFDLPEE